MHHTMSMNYPKRHVFLGRISMYVGFFILQDH